jgi:hypothetical protein
MINQKKINIIGLCTGLIFFFFFIYLLNFSDSSGFYLFIFPIGIIYFFFIWECRSRIGDLVIKIGNSTIISIIKLSEHIIKLLKKFYNQI